jgi:hypothetical protein
MYRHCCAIGKYTTTVSEQRLRKYIPTEANTDVTIGLLHEAEESPLLEAVARERMVKTQLAGKGLAGAVVICDLWRLAMAL